MDKLISYHNYKGGINNLQVVKIVSASPFNGLCNIIKIFTSKNHLAEKRADSFIKKYNQ